MGMDHWDHSVPDVSIWREVFRTLRPGAFCLAFCSPELYHRLACNVEDAGFIIKDQIMWMTTTKMAKYNRLKPAHEPIVVGQKPYEGSLKDNHEKWGCGLIDTETTRVPWEKTTYRMGYTPRFKTSYIWARGKYNRKCERIWNN